MFYVDGLHRSWCVLIIQWARKQWAMGYHAYYYLYDTLTLLFLVVVDPNPPSLHGAAILIIPEKLLTNHLLKDCTSVPPLIWSITKRP